MNWSRVPGASGMTRVTSRVRSRELLIEMEWALWSNSVVNSSPRSVSPLLWRHTLVSMAKTKEKGRTTLWRKQLIFKTLFIMFFSRPKNTNMFTVPPYRVRRECTTNSNEQFQFTLVVSTLLCFLPFLCSLVNQKKSLLACSMLFCGRKMRKRFLYFQLEVKIES